MIRLLTVKGVFAENCYFYIDDATGSGFIIDPGAQAGLIYDTVVSNRWHIEKNTADARTLRSHRSSRTTQ